MSVCEPLDKNWAYTEIEANGWMCHMHFTKSILIAHAHSINDYRQFHSIGRILNCICCLRLGATYELSIKGHMWELRCQFHYLITIQTINYTWQRCHDIYHVIKCYQNSSNHIAIENLKKKNHDISIWAGGWRFVYEFFQNSQPNSNSWLLNGFCEVRKRWKRSRIAQLPIFDGNRSDPIWSDLIWSDPIHSQIETINTCKFLNS